MSAPSHWSTAKLRTISDIRLGKMLDKAKNRGTPHQYLRNINVRWEHFDLSDLFSMPFTDAELEQYEIRDGDLLVCEGGEPGRAAVWRFGKTSIKFQKAIHRVRFEDGLVPEFFGKELKYAAAVGSLQEAFVGTTIKHLTRQVLAERTVPVPPVAEQRRIVAKLDALDASAKRARADLDRVSALVARTKQAILAKAFRGDLTSDWRIRNPRKSASTLLSEIGIRSIVSNASVPSSWTWVLAGDLCDVKGGLALGKKHVDTSALIERPYLRVANVQRGWLSLDEIKTVQVTAQEARSLELLPGDVLMNEGGDRDKLGRGWVWEGQIPNCIHQNHVFRLRPRSKAIPSKFISMYANEFGQKYFTDAGKQTTNLASISMSKVRALPVPLTSPDEMREIVCRIETAFATIDRIAAEATSARKLLDRLDQAILAKAFRGELVPQDPNDEPARVLLVRIADERAAKGKEPTDGRGRKPNGPRERVMKEQSVLPRDRLLKDSEKWPAVGLPFEAIAKRNKMPHDELRDAIFELLSGSSPSLRQRFDEDAEVMVIQRVRT